MKINQNDFGGFSKPGYMEQIINDPREKIYYIVIKSNNSFLNIGDCFSIDYNLELGKTNKEKESWTMWINRINKNQEVMSFKNKKDIIKKLNNIEYKKNTDFAMKQIKYYKRSIEILMERYGINLEEILYAERN